MTRLGFTLPEVIIATLVAVIVGGVLFTILVSNTGLFYQQSSRVTQGLGLNDTMLSIRSLIKEASAVSSGYPEASPIYTTSSTTLVLKLAIIDSSGQVIEGGFDYGVFVIEDEKLKIKVFPSTSPASSRKSQDQILASSVDTVIFNYYDSSGNEIIPTSAVKIKTTLVLKEKTGAKFEINVATSEARLRND